jgi:hypothetical protein
MAVTRYLKGSHIPRLLQLKDPNLLNGFKDWRVIQGRVHFSVEARNVLHCPSCSAGNGSRFGWTLAYVRQRKANNFNPEAENSL